MPQKRTPPTRLLIPFLIVSVFVLGPLVGSAGADEVGADAGRRPYVVEHEFVGWYGCGVTYGPLRSQDWCRGIDPNAQTKFQVGLDPRLTTIVIALDAEGGTLGRDAEYVLTFVYPNTLPTLTGPVPMFHTIPIDDKNRWPTWEEEGRYGVVDVRLSDEADLPQFGYQVPIVLCLGLFYNDLAVPEGYHPCPEE